MAPPLDAAALRLQLRQTRDRECGACACVDEARAQRAFHAQAEALRQLASGSLLDYVVKPFPLAAARGIEIANGVADAGLAVEEDAQQEPASEDGGFQTQFVSKDDLARMRHEMREACRNRLRDQARRRAGVDSECPLFMSLRMRRLLEFALDIGERAVSEAPATAIDVAALPDAVARVIAALIFQHKVPPSHVRNSLEDVALPRGPLGAGSAGERQLYDSLLAQLRDGPREDIPKGVNLETRSDGRPAELVAAALGSASKTTYGVDGFRIEDVVLQPRRANGAAIDRGAPRPWFGVDNDSMESDNYVYRRAIHPDLPIAKHKAEIQRLIKDNQIVLIQGETGCGKTTQVPQYILEAVLSAYAGGDSGRAPRIVVTQPRRIAAITVAKRVAEELGEKVGEGVVGYKIRGTTVASSRCRILFCTTGVVLRRLANEGSKWMFSPKTVTHLLVDEVHERGVETDFMLTFLKEVQATRPNLRVVLMSATMDTDCFRRYFTMRSEEPVEGGEEAAIEFEPPTIHCPAFCYPVEELYLEDMQRRLGRESYPEAKSQEQLYASRTENDAIDYELIQQTIEELEKSPDGPWTFVPEGSDKARAKDPTKGAILIFLPGLEEITNMMAAMQDQSSLSSKFWVLALHANLPPDEQQTCFNTTLPAGCTRKIICATNVAETSVTVPDVTVVIDTCRERKNQVDKFSNTPMLREQWCGKDSLKQRRGRAGRVQPGVCFRVLPRAHMERLAEVTPPEMQRVPLENVYLQVCASGHHHPPDFLARTPDPPLDSAIRFAELALRDLGALEEREDGSIALTPLGRHLASLPCHPRLGKILVLGCLLGVPGPCLSICAAMSVRNPMMTTQDKGKRSAWQAARLELVEKIDVRSDHCVWAYIMQEWRFGDVKQRELCRQLGLSFERMCSSMFERKHLCEALVQVGLLPARFLHDDPDSQDRMPDWALVRGAVVGGLYPNIIRVEKQAPRSQLIFAPKGKTNWMRYSLLQKHYSEQEGMSYPKAVHLHPNSLCFGVENFHCPWLAFYTLQHTSKLYAYDVSEVNPFALLLFGAEPVFDEKSGEFEVGGWARFKCPSGGKIRPLLLRARRAWVCVLERKLEDAGYDIAASKELQACVELLRTGGLGFRPPSPPPILRARARGARKEDEFDEGENEISYMMRKDKDNEEFTKAAWSAAKHVAS